MKNSNKCYLLIVRKSSCLITLSGENQSDGELVDFQGGDLIDQVDNIVETLLPLVPPGRQIVVGVDPSLCLSTTIDAPSPQMLRKPRVLHYHLEEWLPWSADDFVSDFVGHRNSAFTVALETTGMFELAQGLGEAGVDIAAISPLPLLALNGLQSQSRLPKNCLVVWQDKNQIDLMSLSNNKPYSWQRIIASETDLLTHLALLRTELSQESPVVPVQLSKGLVDLLLESHVPIHDPYDVGLLSASIEFSQKVVSGKREPFIDLQKEALAGLSRNQRLKLEWILLAVAVLISASLVSGTLWLKAQEMEKAQLAVETQLEELYREIASDGPIPERIGVAIGNMHRKLKGAEETPKELPAPVAADVVLEKALKRLPKKIRLRIPEITVDHSRIAIGAEVRSNAHADLIAKSLRGGGFEIKPPRTRRLTGKGFSARISGELIEGDEEQ